MHRFIAPLLLLLALSPLTILAQPPRAQTALPEENSFVDDLENFVSFYRPPERTQQGKVARSIGDANGALFSAVKHFVPKVPCATVDRVFGQCVELEAVPGRQLPKFRYQGRKYNDHLLDQADAVVKSPAQLRDFAEKVEAIRANDVALAKTFLDLWKEIPWLSASGDHLEVTISIGGANSDRQEIE
ncbi:MAG: hypothetical protein L6R36_000883 [Xanthoria steineri]|nr:MAG: hypothetical protein L6R36_000883 [Xanthoria steineri]